MLIPLSPGYISDSAGIAAFADSLLAAGLLVPGLPDAGGRARDVAWRLLMVAIAGAAIATSAVARPLMAGATERQRLDEVGFGVVSRGCEHRLVDAASQQVAQLPADHRIDWWRISESVPVVNGAVPITLVKPALDVHARVLVQVGDVVDRRTHPVGPARSGRNWQHLDEAWERR